MTILILRRPFGSTGALAALGLALPILAHANCKVESYELPVKMVGSRAVTMVTINGTPVPMTVDSGAFYSILTDAAAAQLNLKLKKNSNPNMRIEGIAGRVETKTTTVDKLGLLKGEIERVEFFVGGNEPGAGTMGLMGRNILAFTDAEYDLAHGVIRLLFPNDDCAKSNMAYWAGSSPVTEIDVLDNYRNKVPAIRTKVKLNGTSVVALFDTGATTVVSARAAARAGIAETDLKPAGIVYGLGSGSAKAWTAAFDTFELGGETVRNNRLRVADFDLGDADMLLGIDFFLSHRIYISKKQEKMFVTYNGGPVFSLDRNEVASAPGAETEPAATADQFARRGAASASRRDYESALADLNRAVELEPTNAAYFAQRGGIQQTLRRPAKALEDFDKALELDASEADARFRRAVLRFNMKDRDAAKADLDALDKALAPQAQMRLDLSRLYLEVDQPAQAIAQINQWLPAHTREFTRGSAFNIRCLARLKLGIELDKALDDCDEAVDTDAKNAAYLDSRGWVYLRQGKYKKALDDFEHSIESNPKIAASLYGRGLAKTSLGDATQGKADVAAARKLQVDIDLKVPRTGLVAEPPPKP